MMMRGDMRQLSQAVSNLIGNAIKYTQEGGKINVMLGVNGRDAEFRVVDNGYGIPEEAMPHLFDAFYRASNINGTHGTGLGLTIARDVVRGHGGDLLLEDAPGGGLRARVLLPA